MGDPDFFQVNLILNQKQGSSVDKVFLYLCWRATVRCHLIGQNVIYKCISKRTTSLFIISNPKGKYISLVQYCYNHVSCKYFILKKKYKIPVLWSLAITSCFCFIWRRAVVLVVNRLDKMWFWAVILFLHFLHLNNNPKEQFLTTIFSNNLQQYSSTTILNELFFTIILLLHFLHLNKANFPPNISSVQWRHNKEIHQEVCDIF